MTQAQHVKALKVPETADSNSMDSHDFAVSESEMGMNISKRSITG